MERETKEGRRAYPREVGGVGRDAKEAAICRCKRMNDCIRVSGGNPDVRGQETNARGFTRLWLRR